MHAKNPNRTMGEIELVSSHFGNVVFDPDDPTCVEITHFDLPHGFNRRYSRLIIDLGPRYPEYPPQDWYLDRGLLKYGNRIPHYFNDGYGKRYARYGFAWFCFHIQKWMPNPRSIIDGDNLLTATEAVYKSLERV